VLGLLKFSGGIGDSRVAIFNGEFDQNCRPGLSVATNKVEVLEVSIWIRSSRKVILQ
jgi:hypothetical protein